eukprot:FR741349.1.p3 GENE.FR741349.1~~FR741349.1.p3  ORF type:complete len:123 (-),score=79.05 FR741349.1:814-1182(-)
MWGGFGFSPLYWGPPPPGFFPLFLFFGGFGFFGGGIVGGGIKIFPPRENGLGPRVCPKGPNLPPHKRGTKRGGFPGGGRPLLEFGDSLGLGTLGFHSGGAVFFFFFFFFWFALELPRREPPN